MEQTTHEIEALPVACTLDAATMAKRAGEIEDIFAAVEVVEMLPDGYALRFPHAPDIIHALGKFIAVESDCCSFLTYELVCEPGRGPVWLRLRGDDDGKAFAHAMFVSRVGRGVDV